MYDMIQTRSVSIWSSTIERHVSKLGHLSKLFFQYKDFPSTMFTTFMTCELINTKMTTPCHPLMLGSIIHFHLSSHYPCFTRNLRNVTFYFVSHTEKLWLHDVLPDDSSYKKSAREFGESFFFKEKGVHFDGTSFVLFLTFQP